LPLRGVRQRALSWIDSPEWERQIGYEPDTLVTDVTLTRRQFGLVLHVRDAVDATIGVRVQVPAGGQAVCHCWSAASTRFNDVKTLNSVVLGKTPPTLLIRTRDFWRL
jgi:hypothetical protein